MSNKPRLSKRNHTQQRPQLASQANLPFQHPSGPIGFESSSNRRKLPQVKPKNSNVDVSSASNNTARAITSNVTSPKSESLR